MNALGYDGPEEVTKNLKHTPTSKDGCLLWEEFLDFFFMRQSDLEGRSRINKSETWWRRVEQQPSEQKNADANQDGNGEKKDSPPGKKGVPRYGAGNAQANSGPIMPYNYEDPDKKPVKITESLKMLQDTRRDKVTQEVEDEFRALHQKQVKQKSLAASSLPSGSKKASK